MLGSYGFTSPTYFPSPVDVTRGNDEMLAICASEPERVRMFVTVNPNYTDHALNEIDRCVSRGAIGIKLLASRRADDPLLDPIGEVAAERGLPVLHHIWQRRTREWPSREISDGVDLARLAARHPSASFILAHIGGARPRRLPCAVPRGRRYAEHARGMAPGRGVDHNRVLDEAIALSAPIGCCGAPTSTMCAGSGEVCAHST